MGVSEAEAVSVALCVSEGERLPLGVSMRLRVACRQGAPAMTRKHAVPQGHAEVHLNELERQAQWTSGHEGSNERAQWRICIDHCLLNAFELYKIAPKIGPDGASSPPPDIHNEFL